MSAFRTVRWIAISAILLFTAGLAAGQTVRSASRRGRSRHHADARSISHDLGGGTVAGANGSLAVSTGD
jgi:hypothetical protein